jgi:4-amino-4-deoxy-L-arabinose transferase-like glycosyltransferase
LALLSSRELWLDETYSAFEAQLPFRQLLHFSLEDVHTPLFSILLWIWGHVVGDTQVRLRLFSLLLNIASMVVMVFLAHRVLGPRFGAYAVVLYAFSPMLLIYSQEVRSYMLFVLVVVCLLLVHWIVAVEGNDSRGFVLTYGLWAAILFYVHYLAIFVLFVHWAISSRLVRSRMWRLCTVGVMTAMLVSSGLALMRHQYQLKVELDHRLKVSRTNPTALSYGAGEPESSSVRRLAVTLARSSASIAGVYPAEGSCVAAPLLFPLCVLFGIAALLVRGTRSASCLSWWPLPLWRERRFCIFRMFATSCHSSLCSSWP